MEINEGKLAQRYAVSLIETATEKKQTKEFLDQLTGINGVFSDNPDFFKLMKNPLVSVSEKKATMKDVFKSTGIINEINNFLYILLDNDRINLIDKILFFFKMMYQDAMNISTAVLYSAIKLDEKAKKSLSERLEKFFDKKIELKYEIDPSLLGGVVVKMNNQVIDYSIKGQLDCMKQALKKEG